MHERLLQGNKTLLWIPLARIRTFCHVTNSQNRFKINQNRLKNSNQCIACQLNDGGDGQYFGFQIKACKLFQARIKLMKACKLEWKKARRCEWAIFSASSSTNEWACMSTCMCWKTRELEEIAARRGRFCCILETLLARIPSRSVTKSLPKSDPQGGL